MFLFPLYNWALSKKQSESFYKKKHKKSKLYQAADVNLLILVHGSIFSVEKTRFIPIMDI
jgi:hypothetical protein